MIVHSEFRDGNVPAGYKQLRVLKESLENLPEGVEVVRVRSDTAGYQHDLLRYCEQGQNERFGRIEFAIGCDVTEAFKEAVSEVEESEWKPLFKEVKGERKKTHREWAEVCFVPHAVANSKKAPEYRSGTSAEAFAGTYGKIGKGAPIDGNYCWKQDAGSWSLLRNPLGSKWKV